MDKVKVISNGKIIEIPKTSYDIAMKNGNGKYSIYIEVDSEFIDFIGNYTVNLDTFETALKSRYGELDILTKAQIINDLVKHIEQCDIRHPDESLLLGISITELYKDHTLLKEISKDIVRYGRLLYPDEEMYRLLLNCHIVVPHESRRGYEVDICVEKKTFDNSPLFLCYDRIDELIVIEDSSTSELLEGSEKEITTELESGLRCVEKHLTYLLNDGDSIYTTESLKLHNSFTKQVYKEITIKRVYTLITLNLWDHATKSFTERVLCRKNKV